MNNPYSAETLIKRQASLTALLAQHGFDALALNAGPSQTYFSGLHFHIMERPVVLLLAPRQAPVLVLPGFEKGKTEGLGFELRTLTYGEDPSLWQASFDQAAQQLGTAKRIAVEGLHLRVMELRYLEAAFPGASFEAAEGLLGQLRMRKDAGELIRQLYAHGCDPALPFQPIVAAGPNSANPHATVSDRKLQKGDLLLFDWGASVDGYFSDLTRTFAVGELDEELKRIYEIVKLANQAGRQAAKPGAACAAVDEAAREVIEDSGYGAYFTHRTGHGLGLEAHEEPYMRAGNPMKLEPGMTFTVEPGIYLDGRGGVRIEDNVVITADGARSLSSFSRELRVIGD